MRALFSLASLVIVVCIVIVLVQHQLIASREKISGASPASSAPFGGSDQPTPAQFKRELDRTLKEGARERAAAVEGAETAH